MLLRGTVVTTTKDRLAALLGELTTPGAFSAQRTAPVDDLHLEVRGVGRILFPLPKEQAAQLCGVGRPAMYGRGDKTLLDPRVRDTREIPKSRVKVDKRRWARTFLPVLDRMMSSGLVTLEKAQVLQYGTEGLKERAARAF